MITLIDSNVWCTNPIALWTIKYEYQRIGADMQYRFYWKIWLNYNTGWWYNAMQLKLFLDGVQYNVHVKDYKVETGWSYEGTTDWYTVNNKTVGTTLFYVQLYDESANTTDATSSTYYLTVSPCGATIISASDFTDEENPSILYSNPAGANVSKLQACISFTSAIADIEYRDIPVNSTSYTFELTNEERTILQNGTSGNNRTVVFIIRTKIDEKYFYSTLERTLTIVNADPVFSEDQLRCVDTNTAVVSITGNNEQLVQEQSLLTVFFSSATGRKGAGITQYIFELNGITKVAYESGYVEFGKVYSARDTELIVTVMDSRGNKTSVTKTIPILAWSLPTFDVTLERLNNYEDETHLTVNASVSPLDGKNTMKISYRYAENGTQPGNLTEITNNAQYILSCDKNKSFIFDFTVKDLFDKTEKSLILYKGKFPLFIDVERNAVGVNEFPTNGEALRVSGGVANFDGGIQIAGINIIDYIFSALTERGYI
ncbi:MAG: hypothetical protein E7593_03955 [Ruminococcaceae bacterium]|nr:hypothetical protein [Oscillospiraceae bacterium]